MFAKQNFQASIIIYRKVYAKHLELFKGVAQNNMDYPSWRLDDIRGNVFNFALIFPPVDYNFQLLSAIYAYKPLMQIQVHIREFYHIFMLEI